ncbi:classical arabinogalactan protein 9-like [Pistacia vera]|uniref:classical arabinogalactan protein 9-like n=1 Tax=Pistacia vera TaxID=55513 RepID=UPI001263191F|nr:classical arabinogalactan protein 9-like [Pistacia vera]
MLVSPPLISCAASSSEFISGFPIPEQAFAVTMVRSTSALSTLMPLLLVLSTMAQSPSSSPSPSPTRSPPLISPPPASAPPPVPSPSSVMTSPPGPPPLAPSTPSVISTPPAGAPAPSVNAGAFNRFSVGGSVAAGLFAAVLVM